MNTFTIDKTVPLPSRAIKISPKQKLKNTLAEMQIGESFFVSFEDIIEHHIRAHIANFHIKTANQKKFTCQKDKEINGLRVWRVE